MSVQLTLPKTKHTHTHSNEREREREKKMDMQTIQNSDCKQIPFKRTTRNAYNTYVQLI